MAESGIDIDTGVALSNQTNNSPSELNTKFSVMEASIEDAFDTIAQSPETATNDSGGALAAGELVYVSGYDSTNTRAKCKKAISALTSVATFYASYVVVTGGADQAVVTIAKRVFITATDTSGLTAGRPIFLNTTAAGWTGTLPVPTYRIQQVGYVLEVDGSAGVVLIDLPGSIIPFGDSDDV